MAGATPPGQDERNPSTGVQRPSLFSATADDTVRIEPDTSIMAALDGRLRKPPPSRTAPVWGAVGAVAVVMGLAAWLWQDNAAAPVAARAASVPAAKVAVKPPEAASTVASAPASAALASAESAASAVVARAVIEETAAGEPKAAAVAAQAPATTASTPLGGAAVATVGTAVAAVAVTRNPEPRVVKPARDLGKASAKATSAKPAEPVAAAAKTAKVDTKQATEAAPTPAAKDADVELLAAMMRYSDEVSAPGTGKAKAQSGAARMNELTIADLVQRCKALGGDEASQCKKRICSGYWGKAEACPAKQAPVASKPRKQPA